MSTTSQPAFASGERPPGEVFGRYTAIAALGTGGMADVYLAVARGMEGFNKVAVVKRLRASSEPGHVQMFLDEARLAARLAHPNIVHTYEVGEADGGYFIAMEYLEGQSLEKVARRLHADGEGFPETLAGQVMVLLLKALHYTHELKDYDGTPLRCVHRDVSPQNVFLTYGGEVKLLDFGIAKAALNTTVTDVGELKGKIRYMSPEQVAGEAMDGRADIYAAGVILWELLTGRGLYEGDAMSVMGRIVNAEPPRASSVRADCDPTLDAIAARALRLDPDARYPMADAMRADLEAYLRERGTVDTEEAISRAMLRHFGEARAEASAQLQSFLAAAATLDATRPLPVFHAGSEGSGRRARPPVAVAEPTPARPVRLGAWLPLLGGLGVVGLALVVWLGRHPGGDAPAPRVVAPLPTPAPATYEVHLVSTPEGASIALNGKALGQTPATVSVPVGAQTLVVAHDGFEPTSLVVEASEGEVVLDRRVELRPLAPVPPMPGAAASAASSITAAVRTAPPSRGAPKAKPQGSAASSARPLHIRVIDNGDSP